MKPAALLGAALAAVAFPAGAHARCSSDAPPPAPVGDDLTEPKELTDLFEKAKKAVIDRLHEDEKALRARGEAPRCTADKLIFRREYGSLSKDERLAYVNAVKCLQSKPPRTPASVAPGARSRFDDFVVVHIQQTLDIHYSGIFQAWHRWFVYQYEKALRDECGYTGYQPYWDWPKYASAPQDSPLFNGDPYSLGGNGEYVPHDGPVIVPPEGVSGGNISLPAGVGGGFVRTGPFANMTVNLGPVGGLADTAPGPQGGLGYNPRGLKRDLGGAMNTRYANYTTVLRLLTQPDVDAFRTVSEGVPYTVEIGPHGGIHYTIGGDPGGDLFTSPGDPAFWVHHAQMDRVWATWQALGLLPPADGGDPDPARRYTDLGKGDYAHRTWQNSPPSPFAELSDVIDMGYAAPSTTIGAVMSTTEGELCYFYL
ncbi:tyrosinase-like protein [Thermothelomyces thermophilus ATCC 42464]|uniref:Tyrosinase-like protein n=2 Tax=Thermothelomyces thermophilus TaxID=78579 RepID=G2QLD3_THET4|nr:tyrosinase-like protein [Thermothelomyces thermophilus ATCC 42464]AEO60765.1 tyrosinase-like protein [Thermothelomyces thermophilus ATCC 42464]AON76803.1 PPO2 [Thermothelomyces thermophilus]